jgi:NAD(P)-dependent dehydrogenase (short-subunit alcohol dehydrogenase family)
MMVYGATKAAVDSLTRSLAMAYGKTKLATFNSVTVGGESTYVGAYDSIPSAANFGHH